MKHCAPLIALFLCLNIYIDGKTSPMRVVCRLEGLENYDHRQPRLPIDYFDPFSLCSHIILDPHPKYHRTTSDCKLRFSVDLDFTQNEGYQRIMKLTKKNPQLKVMLSIDTDDIWIFLSAINTCRNSRRNRTRNDVQLTAEDAFLELIKHYKFSGLDMKNIWNTEKQRDLLVTTQQALRRNRKLFTLTIDENIEDIDEVTRKINHTLFDFINFQPFNWQTVSKGFHYAPLYENFPNNSSLKRRNVNETVHLIKHYHPLSKIVFGISFRGIGWAILPKLIDTRSPVTVFVLEENGMSNRYAMPYSYICNAIQTKGWRIFYEDVTRNISPYAVAPINDHERMWMSFEDPATVIVKSKYMLDIGLGGVYLTYIEGDDLNNTCGEGPSPLFTAILRTLNTVSPVTALTESILNTSIPLNVTTMSPVTALTESILNTSVALNISENENIFATLTNSLNNSFPSVIRDENLALRCSIAFALGLMIVFCYVITLIYVFVKFYSITRQSRYNDFVSPTTNDEYAEIADVQVIYDTIQ